MKQCPRVTNRTGENVLVFYEGRASAPLLMGQKGGNRMGKKMTWEEMQQQFPNEWLLITDFELDESGHLVAGIVDRHSKDKEVVYRLPALQRSTAFRYTGESTFAGLRSHAETRHIV